MRLFIQSVSKRMATAIFLAFFALNMTNAQAPTNEKDTTLPKIFTIGEFEDKYEKLQLEHSKQLLTACDDDMNKAFEKWNALTTELEVTAKEEGFDMSEIKMWAYVFWDASGRIEHIAYYLKPNSRFVRPTDLQPILDKFITKHRLGLTTTYKFSHYGSFVFGQHK